ncbi:MAG: hypothetical protein DRI99_01785 [Candidatus Aminicenantes bacterium]|nr:DUF167 domain-containing protein [Candidatus Aminicenantes bacterium]RLE04243.1 MAG: hypothetical protein DRJ11_01840 [Candidatus Aminicenantes bacterium]RLE05578.1 MAG: hypothetical protein DRI99_01785 [Candidatus Aminicenantes bacterium]HHF42303.1 DUF167 domain-containing protein [Candidatus Aminicenantes bacterium]
MEKKSSPHSIKKRYLQVKVFPRSKNPGVFPQENGTFIVRVTAPPEKGQANREVLARLAAYLNLPLQRIQIHRGHTSRYKVIVIDNS